MRWVVAMVVLAACASEAQDASTTTVAPDTTHEAAPYPTSPPTTQRPPASLGDDVAVGDGRIVRVLGLTFDPCTGPEAAAPGHTWALLEVEVENAGDGFLSTGNWTLELLDAGGQRVGPIEPSNDGCHPSGNGINVAAGETIPGSLSFEIPGDQRYEIVAEWTDFATAPVQVVVQAA